jgi:hypothetical protein
VADGVEQGRAQLVRAPQRLVLHGGEGQFGPLKGHCALVQEGGDQPIVMGGLARYLDAGHPGAAAQAH